MESRFDMPKGMEASLKRVDVEKLAAVFDRAIDEIASSKTLLLDEKKWYTSRIEEKRRRFQQLRDQVSDLERASAGKRIVPRNEETTDALDEMIILSEEAEGLVGGWDVEAMNREASNMKAANRKGREEIGTRFRGNIQNAATLGSKRRRS